MKRYLAVILMVSTAARMIAQETETPKNTPQQLVHVIMPIDQAANSTPSSQHNTSASVVVLSPLDEITIEDAAPKSDHHTIDIHDVEPGPGPEPFISDLPTAEPTPDIQRQLLSRYPTLAGNQALLNSMAQELHGHPLLTPQAPASNRKTRRVNFAKFHASPAATPNTQSPRPRDEEQPLTGSLKPVHEDNKQPEPQHKVDPIGNAVISMILENSLSTHKKQKTTTYLTAAGGALATALCGLLVKYVNGQCN